MKQICQPFPSTAERLPDNFVFWLQTLNFSAGNAKGKQRKIPSAFELEKRSASDGKDVCKYAGGQGV